MELALGTVQFGLSYGIANDGGQVSRAEAARILQHAYAAGIRRLDTAAAYGDIEENLAELCGVLDFEIVSKVSAIAPELSTDEAIAFVTQSIQRSCDRLGERLTGILFHDAASLAGDRGKALWKAGLKIALQRGFKLGSSGYEPAEIRHIGQLPGFAMAQLPGNALDQRVQTVDLPAVELTLRSAFLQGLLLMTPGTASRRLPLARPAMDRWLMWCKQRKLDALPAAFATVKGFGRAQYCVIGVDSVDQLTANIAAWQTADAIPAPELAVDDPRIFDPRLWPKKELSR